MPKEVSGCRVGKEHTCPVCGRTFIVPYSPRTGGGSQWRYKYRKNNKTEYCCKYSCFRKANDRKAAI